MNLYQGYLNALQVSTPELEELIHIARRARRAGRKTDRRGRRRVDDRAVPRPTPTAVAAAIEDAGYQTLTFTVPGSRHEPAADPQPVVSSEEERLILVDSDDRETGTSTKSACHDGDGVLHRAFSLFVFNRRGELLIHQRHPRNGCGRTYWSNSCCSHPRAGEEVDVAVHRRLEQELGLTRRSSLRLQVRIRRAVRRRRHRTRMCWVYAATTDATR